MYKRKRADLVAVLDSTLSPLFLGQLKNLHKACLVAFKNDMHEGMRGDGYNFADVVSGVRSKVEKRFVDAGKEALVEETDWTYEDEFLLLKEEMRSVADQCRKDETKKMINAIEVWSSDLNFMFRETHDYVTAELQEADLRTSRSASQ